jgi:hypothetical protein
MTETNNKTKLTRIDLIESIKIHYLKKGLLCQNLDKMCKAQLLDFAIQNEVDFINKDQLKDEIIDIENYNFMRDIIYCNFIKYENVPYETISSINLNTTNDELKEIINKYNLKHEDNFKNTKDLIFNIYKSYKNYCEKSSIKNECTYITLPSIIKALKGII